MRQNATESNDERNIEAEVDIITELSKYRVKNKDKVVLATLNINSIRNKFSSLLEIISNNIDVLVIQETKIDASFHSDPRLPKTLSEEQALPR